MSAVVSFEGAGFYPRISGRGVNVLHSHSAHLVAFRRRDADAIVGLFSPELRPRRAVNVNGINVDFYTAHPPRTSRRIATTRR